jgi:hypothetical protein
LDVALSEVTTRNESVPGGDGGPATVHGLQGGVTVVLTGLPVIEPTVTPAESAVSETVTVVVVDETNFGCRALLLLLPRAGIVIWNVGLT